MFATSIASVSSHFWHHYARTISDAYRPIALVGVIRLERKRCHLGRVGRQPLADAKAYSLNEKAAMQLVTQVRCSSCVSLRGKEARHL